MPKLIETYCAKVEVGEISKDAAQEKVIVALDRLACDVTTTPPSLALLLSPRLRRNKGGSGWWKKKSPVKGVYIYGGVGRGKSMVMDLFFASLPATIKKRRIHFHAFMIETQDWLHQRRAGKAVDNLLPEYAKHVSDRTKVLCFDEFHVTDIADAMILSRLFTALFEKGVAVVATSNWPPDRLYEGGLQRERFLPFIALLKERMEIVHLDSEKDYRVEAVQDLETYLSPLNKQTKEKADLYFSKLADGKPEENMVIRVKGRDIPVRTANGAARFTFTQLCEQPHGAEDYIRIGEQFHSIFIENIPKLTYDRRNETKRLMTLIDVLYDMRKRVVITAEAAPDKLYYGHDYEFEFARTISRLQEMQSSSYYTEAA